MKNILIIGATSAIAQAVARLYAAQGASFFLIARNGPNLEIVAKDLQSRGALRVQNKQADLSNFSAHKSLIDEAHKALGGMLDIVLIAHGDNGDHAKGLDDFAEAQRVIAINYLSVVSLLTELAPHLKEQKSGSVAVISSVAGDRGRQSNFIYGSAKAGLSAYLSGYRALMHSFGVAVTTVKPGFVDTPMNSDRKKNFLWASPEQLGRGIVRAIHCRKGSVYLPKFWALIMLVVCAIPESIFKKLKF